MSEIEELRSIVARAQSAAGARGDVEKWEREEEAQARRDDLRLLEAWGVPRRIRESLSALRDTRALEAVRRWNDGRQEQAWCIVLSADKGVGKSTAAGWLLSQMTGGLKAHPSVTRCWWPASELAAADVYGEGFQELSAKRQLVIDDLGVEYADSKGAFASKLDRLLDARYREYRTTVITTNLAAKAFADRYGERVYDRLCEGGTWVGIAGASMRRSA